MHRLLVVFASLAVVGFGSTAHAQSTNAQSTNAKASDSWSQPAHASSVHDSGGPRSVNPSPQNHFKFKDDRSQGGQDFRPDPNRPQSINDTSPLDNNGRPAANCASDPRQSKCH